MHYLKTSKGLNQYQFICEVCGSMGELAVPVRQHQALTCPKGCGATYVQRLINGQPDLMCVARPAVTHGNRMTGLLSVPINASICPPCGNVIEWATHTDGTSVPGPGDLAVCSYCGHVSVFTEDLSIRQLTEDERGHIPNGIRQQLTTMRQLARRMLCEML